MATGEGDGKRKTRWGGVILRRNSGRGRPGRGLGFWGGGGGRWAGWRRRGSERPGSVCPRSSRTSPDGEDAGRAPPPSASVCAAGGAWLSKANRQGGCTHSRCVDSSNPGCGGSYLQAPPQRGLGGSGLGARLSVTTELASREPACPGVLPCESMRNLPVTRQRSQPPLPIS